MFPSTVTKQGRDAEHPDSGVVHELGNGLAVRQGAWAENVAELFSADFSQFLLTLHRELEDERRALLAGRAERQARYDAGDVPEYEPDDSVAAAGDWRVAPIPPDLQKRRVEITGPINSTKMVINMLSRNQEGFRADTAMLDFEDSMKPSWRNVIAGVHNLIGAVQGTLEFSDGAKHYRLDPQDMAKIMVRVRGLHLDESNVLIDGAPVSAGLFDFAMSFFHTARTQVERGQTPKYYIPKCEHYLEARWWNRLFELAQENLHMPKGTLRVTFLIETLPAAFQMEEILYEIREHAAGLNVGRWDKIFSDIKVLKLHPDRIMADRGSIGLNRPWMLNYAKRLIKICHARGAFAIGGMAAFTPGKTEQLRQEQTARVVEDKQLEASIGHDGCWVSHPYFIGPALSAFQRENQTDVLLEEFDKYPDLLPRSDGDKTMAGLRKNIRVGIAYMQGWNQDIGCVAWDNLMEDLATLEISRAQTWQWLHHRIRLASGEQVTPGLVERIFEEELARINAEIRQNRKTAPDHELNAVLVEFSIAAEDAQRIFLKETFDEFLSTSSVPL